MEYQAILIPFAEGWLQNETDVNGRPVDVQVLKDGSLFVSDDYKGVIYRISYKVIDDRSMKQDK